MKTEREMLVGVVEKLNQIDIKLAKIEERLNKHTKDLDQIKNLIEYTNTIIFRR